MHGKRPGNLKKCTGETQLKEGEEAAFVSFFKENLLWWWNHENLLPLLLIPTSCLNYNVCGDICHWPLLCVCVCTCKCSEAEAINSECRGFPDLPIILADAKQRAAARGCRGDTMWNWGWLLHVTGPEWSNASHISSYANRGMTGERQWGWQTCIERQMWTSVSSKHSASRALAFFCGACPEGQSWARRSPSIRELLCHIKS